MLTRVQVTESYAVGEEGSEMSSFGVLSVGNPEKILWFWRKGLIKGQLALNFLCG